MILKYSRWPFNIQHKYLKNNQMLCKDGYAFLRGSEVPTIRWPTGRNFMVGIKTLGR